MFVHLSLRKYVLLCHVSLFSLDICLPNSCLFACPQLPPEDARYNKMLQSNSPHLDTLNKETTFKNTRDRKEAPKN